MLFISPKATDGSGEEKKKKEFVSDEPSSLHIPSNSDCHQSWRSEGKQCLLDEMWLSI